MRFIGGTSAEMDVLERFQLVLNEFVGDVDCRRDPRDGDIDVRKLDTPHAFTC